MFGKGGDRRWLAGSALVAILVVAPVVSLALIAAQGSGDLWPHIFAFVLPQALRETAILLLGVGVMVVTLGTALAWLMTAYEFPGRRVFDWALLLPLAMPAYVVAYAYTDFLQFSGPLQTGLRQVFGLQGRLLPDVRSLGGAVMSVTGVILGWRRLGTKLQGPQWRSSR
jgi:iron(III) transport system permease protein